MAYFNSGKFIQMRLTEVESIKPDWDNVTKHIGNHYLWPNILSIALMNEDMIRDISKIRRRDAEKEISEYKEKIGDLHLGQFFSLKTPEDVAKFITSLTLYHLDPNSFVNGESVIMRKTAGRLIEDNIFSLESLMYCSSSEFLRVPNVGIKTKSLIESKWDKLWLDNFGETIPLFGHSDPFESISNFIQNMIEIRVSAHNEVSKYGTNLVAGFCRNDNGDFQLRMMPANQIG